MTDFAVDNTCQAQKTEPVVWRSTEQEFCNLSARRPSFKRTSNYAITIFVSGASILFLMILVEPAVAVSHGISMTLFGERTIQMSLVMLHCHFTLF